jgi:hypothetical protein
MACDFGTEAGAHLPLAAGTKPRNPKNGIIEGSKADQLRFNARMQLNCKLRGGMNSIVRHSLRMRLFLVKDKVRIVELLAPAVKTGD